MNKVFEQFVELHSNALTSISTDYNIFNSAHLRENNHTDMLWSLLSVEIEGEFPFLKSFVGEVLGIQKALVPLEVFSTCKDSNTPHSGTQISTKLFAKNKFAKSKCKSNDGLMDLFICDSKTAIVIENKVCGASDSTKQLEKYYKAVSNIWVPDNIYIVYLTESEAKKPDKEKRFVSKLGEHYIHATYFETNSDRVTILGWLENTVLPKLKDSMFPQLSTSVQLYIDYLCNEFGGNSNSSNYDSFIANLLSKKRISTLVKLYYKVEIDSKSGSLTNQNCNLSLLAKKFKACIRTCIEEKLNSKINDKNWHICWNPNFVLLYKESWKNTFGMGKLYCPVHWEMPIKNNDYNWSIHLETMKASKGYNDNPKSWEKMFSHSRINHPCESWTQIQGVLNYPAKDSQKELFSMTDSDIIQYFDDLISADQFMEYTAFIEN